MLKLIGYTLGFLLVLGLVLLADLLLAYGLQYVILAFFGKDVSLVACFLAVVIASTLFGGGRA